MNSPLVAGFNSYGLIGLFAHWLALWIGMYLVSRRPCFAATLLAGIAFIAASTYVLDVAFFNVPTSVVGVIARERWLANWVNFVPPLLLHSYVRLTDLRFTGRRWLLALAYVFAAVVFVGSLINNLFSNFEAVQLDSRGYAAGLLPGRFYWVMAFQILFTFACALLVLIIARRSKSASKKVSLRQLDALIAGTALVFLGVCLLALDDSLTVSVSESLFFPFLVVGALLIAVPLLACCGRLDGKLLWADFKASFLGAALASGLFVCLVLVIGASATVLAGVGWIVIAVMVFGDRVQSLADVFYPARVRATRRALRTAAAYAGTLGKIDV
jgi:hypothetical protein